MSIRLLLLVVLASCLPAGTARALDPGKDFNHYVRDTWTVQDGLPPGPQALAQTPDGYVWIGTQEGLARFDGVRFTVFTAATHPALPSQFVVALAVDDAGALWIGTRRGMAVLRNGRIEAVPWNADGDPPHIQKLQLESDGRIWAATTQGPAYVQDGALQPLSDDRGSLPAVTVGADDTLWSAAVGGARRWDGNAWVQLPRPGGTGDPVMDVMHLDGELWTASSDGFHILGPDGWRAVPGASGADGVAVRTIRRDRDGNTWGAGDGGLLRVRPDGRVERFPGSASNRLSNLTSVLEDLEGNLWLAGPTHGLTRLWNGWTRRYSTREGLPDASVWSVDADPESGTVWVGTGNGLARMDRDGRLTPVVDAQVSGPVYAIRAEPGRVWVGMRNGVALYEPGSGRPATMPAWAQDWRTAILGFSRDPDGNLWMGTLSRLLRWDGTSIEAFDHQGGLAGTTAEYRLVTLRSGRSLAVTSAGLFEFDGTAFSPAAEEAGLPEDAVVTGATELADGGLLLLLEDGLLLRRGAAWHRLDASVGLFPGRVYQAIQHAGQLWVTSVHGAYRLSLEELTAFTEGRTQRVHPEMLVEERGLAIGSQHGVCCNGFGPHDGSILGDTLWVPTSDGVLAIDIDDIVRNPLPPAVQLGRVQVDEQWRTLESGSAALDADQRDLTLAFDVLSFQDPRSNQVRYRLAGYDREWKTAASMVREVRYTNLPPGDYAFEVMASNNAGVWTAQPARLEFGIRPYFHETAAFRLLLVGLALLLVYAGYRTQRYRYRMRQAHLERLVDERTEALARSNQDLARSNDQLADSNRQLEQASLTDPLTGLRNRRYLTQQIPADLNYYDRQLTSLHSDTVVFAMLDLDHFKQVNDVYGHATGDRVLEEAARRLRTLVRAGDYVVRWGGEEFLLVFRPMPSAHVTMMGERLRGAMASAQFDIGEGRGIRLTASVGLSEYPLFRLRGEPMNWEEMIELADQAAYYVKRNGRDGWALFRPTDSTPMETLLGDLQRDPAALLRTGALELLGSIAGSPAQPGRDRDPAHGTGDGDAHEPEDRQAAAADT